MWSLDWIFVSAPEMAPNFSRGVKSRKQDYVSRVLELESRFGGLSWTESHLSKQGVLATFWFTWALPFVLVSSLTRNRKKGNKKYYDTSDHRVRKVSGYDAKGKVLMEKPTEAELLSEVLTEVHLMCRRKFMRARKGAKWHLLQMFCIQNVMECTGKQYFKQRLFKLVICLDIFHHQKASLKFKIILVRNQSK